VNAETLKEGRRRDLDREGIAGAGEVEEPEAVVIGLVGGRTDDAVDGALDEAARDEGEDFGGL
jgi:hypothetical protein